MKTRNILLVFTATILFVTQLQAQISLGGGLGYNEKIAGPGITLKGVLAISDNIAISPSASYFFGNSLFGFKRSAIAIDANAHYYFEVIEGNLDVYPVAGINFTRYKTGNSYYDGFNTNTEKISANAIGVNIGAGATYKFTDKLKVYLEPKYIISDYSQIVVNAGVLLSL